MTDQQAGPHADVAGNLAIWDTYARRATIHAALTATGPGDDAVLRKALDDLPDVEALDALRANTAAVAMLVGRRWYVMRDAREAGATWAEIADAVGLTEQAARQFYSEKIAFQEQHVPDLHEAARSQRALHADVEWWDAHGRRHLLWPVGTPVAFTGHVFVGAATGTMYESAPALVIGHDLDDEVTPYRIRINFGGVRVSCLPDQITARRA